MGSIGSTQGVNASAMPSRKKSGSVQPSERWPSHWVIWLSLLRLMPLMMLLLMLPSMLPLLPVLPFHKPAVPKSASPADLPVGAVLAATDETPAIVQSYASKVRDCGSSLQVETHRNGRWW